MRYPMSFKKFLEIGAPNIFFSSYADDVQEDASGQVRKDLKTLEGLLKKMDFYFEYIDGDYREWKKYNEMDKEINLLVKRLGKKGDDLYWKYAKKAGIEKSKNEQNEWNQKGKKNPNKPPRTLAEAVRQVTDRTSFPEMNNTTKNINLGYGEERPVGEKSKHGFVDAGNLWEGTTPWQPPSKQTKARRSK
tara:strand:+ start:132 stop:701 length:570 start_codon:yes stop_codon:yes gene_type:complete